MNESGGTDKEIDEPRKTIVFKHFQDRLMAAANKEDMKKITKELLLVSGGRYKGLREFALEGNLDISERLQFLLRWSKGKVLDVGSYDGYFVLELEKLGFEIDGTDMMEEAIVLFEDAKKHYPESKAKAIPAFSESLPFPPNSYDTVIVSHTLEHVFDPLLSLKECLRVTKDRLIVVVPKELGNDPTHVRVVTEQWLLAALEGNKILCEQDVGNGLAVVVEKNHLLDKTKLDKHI